MKKLVVEKVAILADISGDHAALERVVAELERRDVASIIALGNHFYDAKGNGDAQKVWQILQKQKATLLRGVQEDALDAVNLDELEVEGEDSERLGHFRRTKASLGDILLKKITMMPTDLRLPLTDGSELYCVHGSPAHHRFEISPQTEDHELVALLNDDAADVVAISGSAQPFARQIGDQILLGCGAVASNEDGFSAFAIVDPTAAGAVVTAYWLHAERGAYAVPATIDDEDAG